MNTSLDSIPNRARQFLTLALASLLATTTLASCTLPSSPSQSGDIHKIKHIIVIMQENRSFDTYFGTYPGADGIPMQNGVPTVCVMDPKINTCVKPYHDPKDVNAGGPHAAAGIDVIRIVVRFHTGIDFRIHYAHGRYPVLHRDAIRPRISAK